MATVSVTSSGGRYTLRDEQSWTWLSEWGDDVEGHQITTLTDNITQEVIELYSSLKEGGGGWSNNLFFSPDSKVAFFQKDGDLNDYAPYFAYDINSGNIIKFTGTGVAPNQISISANGSKITWYNFEDYLNGIVHTFYIPSVPQFAPPTISGTNVGSTGSGTVRVGDVVFIRLDLKGIAQANGQDKITLSLNSGGTAFYDAEASRPGEFYTFKYIVKADDLAKDLAITSVNLNGAILRGASGTPVFLSKDILDIKGKLYVYGYYGTAGSENFLGTLGAETFEGRGGDDIYRINNVNDKVKELRGHGFDTVVSTIDYQLTEGQEIEILRVARSEWSADIDLAGNEFGQTLEGNIGNNVLDGRGGADVMKGFQGNDTYIVDNARDLVIEAAGRGKDTVATSVSYTLAAGQEVETLRFLLAAGNKNLNLTGNEFGQVIGGTSGNNVLDGKGGIDRMIGIGGNDTYGVDNVHDVVIEAKGEGIDTVVTTVSYKLGAGQEIEGLRLSNATTGNLDLTGNEFAQAIAGNAGDNVLDGKLGADTLVGGRGHDAFLFSTKLGSGNVDRITDFTPADDTIRLSDDIFTTLAPGPMAAERFKNISLGAADADDRILYKQATGELLYDADGSGAGAAVKFAVLTNKAALTSHDFFVV